MIVILLAEAVCIAWCLWGVLTSWRRHAVVKAERVQYQSSGHNGGKLRSMIEREDIEHDILQHHAVFLFFNTIIFVWRVNDVLRHTVLWAAAARDTQIFFATWWVWNFTRKRRAAEVEVTDISDREHERDLALREARRELNAKMDTMDGKLDDIKTQADLDRRNGTVVEIKIQDGVDDANVKLDDLKDVKP